MRKFDYEQKEHISTTTRTDAIDLIFKSRIVSFEFANFFLGDYLGGGVSRDVFAYAPDPKKFVIKIERGDDNANVLEDDLWKHVRYVKGIARWFAPIERISPCGRILLMRRAKMDVAPDKYPVKIPPVFTDVKRENFGFIGDQLVCVDYAFNLSIPMAFSAAGPKFKKANWDKFRR